MWLLMKKPHKTVPEEIMCPFSCFSDVVVVFLDGNLEVINRHKHPDTSWLDLLLLDTARSETLVTDL